MIRKHDDNLDLLAGLSERDQPAVALVLAERQPCQSAGRLQVQRLARMQILKVILKLAINVTWR